MTHRIGIRQTCYYILTGLAFVAGITLIGVGGGLGMPAVIIGGIALFASGSMGILFQRMH